MKMILTEIFLIFLNVFLVLIFVLNLALVFLMPFQILENYFISEVKGNSMFPTYRSGDAVIFEIESKEIKRGDIIIFKEDIGYYCHRVIDIKENPKSFLAKGDNNPFADRWVKEKEVAAKQFFNIPLGFFKNPLILISFFLLLIVLILWKKIIFLQNKENYLSSQFDSVIFYTVAIIVISFYRIFYV